MQARVLGEEVMGQPPDCCGTDTLTAMRTRNAQIEDGAAFVDVIEVEQPDQPYDGIGIAYPERPRCAVRDADRRRLSDRQSGRTVKRPVVLGEERHHCVGVGVGDTLKRQRHRRSMTPDCAALAGDLLVRRVI